MIDPFTPWQESPKQLLARTVMREDALPWLVDNIDAFFAGKSRSWCLVTGPRGVGKSHLLQLARSQCTRSEAVIWVPEDTPVVASAAGLWKQIWAPKDRWGWSTVPDVVGPRVVFIEGLDRLLEGLSTKEQWAFRHLLQESDAYVVGTAITTKMVASSDSPFHGQFDPWQLQPLTIEAALELFLHVSGEISAAPGRTIARRQTLTKLAGGSPRTIVTLAAAVRGRTADELGTAEALLGAIQRLVTHYQQRFHDLPPLSQQIVACLAMAPIELTATEVRNFVDASSAAVAGAARGLEANGTLQRNRDRRDGRISRYRLTEPMYRYWLEYRTGHSWDHSRISSLCTILDEVTRERLSALPPEPGLPAVVNAMPDRPTVQMAAQVLTQLAERENGPLQPELELVWQAVAPRDD